MIFCTNMYLDIIDMNPIEFQGHCLLVTKVHFVVFTKCRKKIPVYNAAFRLLILHPFQRYSWSNSRVLPNSCALLITHEPLDLTRWNFVRTCTSTTSRTLLNIKVIRHIGFWVLSMCVMLRLPAHSTWPWARLDEFFGQNCNKRWQECSCIRAGSDQIFWVVKLYWPKVWEEISSWKLFFVKCLLSVFITALA